MIFYLRLTDKRSIVRYSAFKTITDLIHQEMFKIRGQVAGMARLIVDEDENIKRILIIALNYYLTLFCYFILSS